MMKSLPRDSWDPLNDPLHSQKNPHQTFLLVLSIWSTFPLLRGSTNSAALDAALGDHTVILWGVSLLLGSIIALIGEFWVGHTWTALVIERTGLGLVSGAAAIYSTVVYLTLPNADEARFVVAVTLAYSLSSLWRCIQITRRLSWIRRVIEEVNREHRA